MPDFLYRLSTTINFIAHSLVIIDRLNEAEIVVVDWNSDLPLSESLSLSADAVKLTRFLYVNQNHPMSVQEKIPLCTAFNTAVRAAKGEYIAFCGGDAIIPPSSIQALFNVFDGKSIIPDPHNKYFNCGRFSIPYQIVKTQPTITGWERFLRMHSWNIDKSSAVAGFLHGSAGYIMCHRDLFSASRGLSEVFDSGWGWNDIDFTLRMMGEYEWYDLHTAGFMIFDMSHEPQVGTRSDIVRQQPPHLLQKALVTNNKNWGTPEAPIIEQRANKLSTNTQESLIRSPLHISSVFHDYQIEQIRDFIFQCNNEIRLSLEFSSHEIIILQCLFQLNDISPLSSLVDLSDGANVLPFFFNHLNPYCHLMLSYNWPDIDDITGPHKIASFLTRSSSKFKGYIRVFINKDSALTNLLRSSDTTRDIDVIVIQGDVREIEKRIKTIYTLNVVFKIIVCRFVCEDELNSFIADSPQSKFIFYSNKKERLAFISECIVGPFVLSNKLLSDYKNPVDKLKKENYQVLVELFSYINKVDRKKTYILYGFGSVGRLIFPHLQECIVAIVDESLVQKDVRDHENIPIISLQEISHYYDSVILITASIYDSEIRKSLVSVSNQIITI